MEPIQAEWTTVESDAEVPSLDFIRAVAELRETDPEDIL